MLMLRISFALMIDLVKLFYCWINNSYICGHVVVRQKPFLYRGIVKHIIYQQFEFSLFLGPGPTLYS